MQYIPRYVKAVQCSKQQRNYVKLDKGRKKSRKDNRKRFDIKDLIINNDRVLQKNYQRTSINL